MNFSEGILRFYEKTIHIFIRIWHWILLLPIRLYRIFRHFAKGLQYFIAPNTPWKTRWAHLKPWTVFTHWSLDMMFYFLDLIGAGEIYETILDIFKFNTRRMTEQEISLAQKVFGNSIDYKRVLIDEYAFAGPKQKRFAYVSFNIINSWGKMRNDLLLHELTHIWQYQRIGSIYIPRALRAQQPQYGYNYGGRTALKFVINNNGTIDDFNLEQQGDIVLDYYRLQNGDLPRWGQADVQDLELYEYFIENIREG